VGDWAAPKPARSDGKPIRRQTGDAPLKVVLDPGHGGIDPGAEAGSTKEAAIVLGFALELAEKLRRAGMVVTLTRTSDVFVPLEARISDARAAGADVFLSLHADALEEGEANGATIYKLAEAASDAASAHLAERHDRADILAGVDLTGNDDEVATVLLDLARTETEPRADRLALALADAIKAAGLKMHRRPIQEAAFSVLKSADVPSLLLEIGFLSSKSDRALFDDAGWRGRMQDAIAAALANWAVPDADFAAIARPDPSVSFDHRRWGAYRADRVMVNIPGWWSGGSVRSFVFWRAFQLAGDGAGLWRGGAWRGVLDLQPRPARLCGAGKLHAQDHQPDLYRRRSADGRIRHRTADLCADRPDPRSGQGCLHLGRGQEFLYPPRL
jgi:N-acetylmuramoyl-L-alanine amidase